MKINLGINDRVIRVLIAVTVFVFYFAGLLSGTWATIMLIISGVFMPTAVIGLCPIYMPFGIKTIDKNK